VAWLAEWPLENPEILVKELENHLLSFWSFEPCQQTVLDKTIISDRRETRATLAVLKKKVRRSALPLGSISTHRGGPQTAL
jgi:hypothetical protein